MSLTSRTRAPRRAVLLGTGALLLAVVCSACGVGAQAEPEAGASTGSPSAAPSARPDAAEQGGADADDSAGAVPATCRGSAAEQAVAPFVKGLPFDETADEGLLSCNWGEDGSREHLFVQFQAGQTFADPDGADAEAERSMGVRVTPEAAKLGGKLQYTDLGSVGRSAVLYLPGVSVTANAVGSGLGQGELESIALAAAEDLPKR